MSLPSSIVKSGVDTFDRTGIRLQPQSSNLRLIKDFGMEPARHSFGNPGALTDCGTQFSYRPSTAITGIALAY